MRSRSAASGTAAPSTPIKSSTFQPELARSDAGPEVRPDSPRDKAPKGRKVRIVALVAVVGVIVLTAGAVLYFTDGFGIWTRPGPIVKPVSATVFSPDGAPDNPQKADLAIDGNPDTAWSTVTYKDPVPFPNFVEGEGLLLHLSEPTALSAVTIDLSSTGTEVQIRSSPTETPATLADTTRADPNHATAAGTQSRRSARPHQNVQCPGVDHQIGHDRWPKPDGNFRDHPAGRCVRSASSRATAAPAKPPES